MNDMRLESMRLKAVTIAITEVGVASGLFNRRSAGLKLYIGHKSDTPSEIVDDSCLMSSMDVLSDDSKITITDKYDILGYISVDNNCINNYVLDEGNIYSYFGSVMFSQDHIFQLNLN